MPGTVHPQIIMRAQGGGPDLFKGKEKASQVYVKGNILKFTKTAETVELMTNDENGDDGICGIACANATGVTSTTAYVELFHPGDLVVMKVVASDAVVKPNTVCYTGVKYGIDLLSAVCYINADASDTVATDFAMYEGEYLEPGQVATDSYYGVFRICPAGVAHSAPGA